MLLEPSYPLRTERLRLRPYRPDDVDAVLSMFGREDVSRYLNWEPMDREAATALVERRLQQLRIEHEGDGIVLVVEEADAGGFVGEMMLRLTSEASRQGEVGWSVHPDAQGRGYATEGSREMLRLGFDELGLHRIVAECDPRNEASIRVMEKLGMRREAHHLDALFLKGEWVGSLVYAMLDAEWRASAESAQEHPARGRAAHDDGRRRPAGTPGEEQHQAERE
jgi:RimJ/RimL family protein N-acetyltransferase